MSISDVALRAFEGTDVKAQTASSSAAKIRVLLICLCVWIIAGLYVGAHLRRGWIPHDEGTYAQSGERVLQGELPHRDFDDLYSGGLSILNALAFRLAGTNLFSMRLALYVFFMAAVPAIFYIGTRFASAAVAGAVTLLSVAWSVPNYSAAVPSWYNLIFAIFGTAALLRYLETDRRGWLFVAGLCGGLSIVFKVSGLYFVAGVLLWFVFRRQCQADSGGRLSAGRLYKGFVVVCLFLFVCALSMIARTSIEIGDNIHFFLPGGILATFLMWREAHAAPVDNRTAFLLLGRMITPFAAGLAAPIGIFLAPYALSGSMHSVLIGWFILPQKHLLYSNMPAPGLLDTAPSVVLAAVVVGAMFLRGTSRLVYSAIILAVLGAALVYSARSVGVYRYAWHSFATLIPAATLLGAGFLLWSTRSGRPTELRQQQLLLLLAVTAVCSIIQYPFAAPVYFCYVAPLLILALTGFFCTLEGTPRFLLGTLFCFYLLFAAFRVEPGFVYIMGVEYRPDIQTQSLVLPRAGKLRVSPDQQETYDELIPLVQAHARNDYIYAAPDCPEIYFLSGLRNPTRTLFDFFDEPQGRTQRILNVIEGHSVNVVVLASEPPFSQPIAGELKDALIARFPNSETVGRFEVRWRL